MKHLILLAAIAIFFSLPSWANSIYSTKSDECSPTHTTTMPDVAYTPGRDVHGWAVQPADMGFIGENESFDLNIDLRLPERYVNNRAFLDKAGDSEIHIGEYHLQDGKQSLSILGNDTPLTSSSDTCGKHSDAILE